MNAEKTLDIITRYFQGRVARTAASKAALVEVGVPDDECIRVGPVWAQLAPGAGLTVTEVAAREADHDADVARSREESRWRQVREERNRRLHESDWTQMGLADSPLTATQVRAWADYRKKLRDITSFFAAPEEVVWPSPAA